jgi:hypothetical protein
MPIRLSAPTPSLIWSMSAPTTRSDMFAMAFMKEIFMARNAFEVCLIALGGVKLPTKAPRFSRGCSFNRSCSACNSASCRLSSGWHEQIRG